jgi:MFS family permease
VARLFADLTPLRVSAPYRRLWAALGISNIGQQMTSVAVGLQVYDLTHSSLMVGLVGLFQLVPLVGFGLYGGTLSDAFDRRKVGVISALGLWACSAAFLAQSALQLSSVAVLYAIIAVQSAFFAVGNPARQAIIPRLVAPELLPAANALGMLTWTFGFTLGPLLGGLLVALTGTVTTPYLVDVVAFGIVV